MTMEEKGKSKRIEEMIADLRSKNDRRVIGALKKVPHEGSPEMIEPMFDLFSEIQTKDVKILLEKNIEQPKRHKLHHPDGRHLTRFQALRPAQGGPKQYLAIRIRRGRRASTPNRHSRLQ